MTEIPALREAIRYTAERRYARPWLRRAGMALRASAGTGVAVGVLLLGARPGG
jgi:hypothetical protein